MDPALLETNILEFLLNSREEDSRPEGLVLAGYQYLTHNQNCNIKGLAKFLIKAIEHNCFDVSEVTTVKTLCFVFHPNLCLAELQIPTSFTDGFRATPIGMLGELVFFGSHIADYLNGLVDDPRRSFRAKAYIAEYFMSVQKTITKWSPTPSQNKILKAYPEGLNSSGVGWYNLNFVEA